MPIIPALWRLQQNDRNSVNLVYTVSSKLKEKNQRMGTQEGIAFSLVSRNQRPSFRGQYLTTVCLHADGGQRTACSCVPSGILHPCSHPRPTPAPPTTQDRICSWPGTHQVDQAVQDLPASASLAP